MCGSKYFHSIPIDVLFIIIILIAYTILRSPIVIPYNITKQEYPNYTNPINATNIAKNLNYFNTTTTYDDVFIKLIPKLIRLNNFIILIKNKTPKPAVAIHAK